MSLRNGRAAGCRGREGWIDEQEGKTDPGLDGPVHEGTAARDLSRRDDGRKAEAVSGYADRLGEVRRAKVMTDTVAWAELYARIQEEIKGHAAAVLEAEKPRDVVRHQEGVKILRLLAEFPRRPVDKLADYCRSMPLFASQFPVSAGWNDAVGRIELTEPVA